MPYLSASGTSLGSANPDPGGATTVLTETTLTDTCHILERERTEDGQGSFSEEWVTVALDVPCALSKALPGVERVLGGVLQSAERFTLQVPIGTDLQPAYTVVKDEQVYQVIDDDFGITNGLYLTAQVVRMRNEQN